MPSLWPHHSTDHSANCVYHVSQTMLFFGSFADCSSPCSAKGKSGNYLFGRAVYAGGIGGGIVLGWGLVPDSVEFPDELVHCDGELQWGKILLAKLHITSPADRV
ncbi:hypothetical protein CCHR01_06528 [Colletotrichum chrysophilum]|uniref:Uncharacterized protein n=1 Tax=Colletotrichum chrysophilum TaxID=1836956 RepID=A0AAD9AQL9_9PEZI|nr:hypothetical protein CCHR01_06528 [Colletotrichum chrysophilum]